MTSDVAAVMEAEIEAQKRCPTCGASHSSWKNYGTECVKCRAVKEKERWASLSTEEKLDELKARMDAAGPAINAAWNHVPLV